MNRVASTARNVAWAIFSRCITTVGPFVVRTFLIYRLGVDYTGLNGLFTSVLQVLNLAELGFSSAIVYSMYSPVAKGETGRVAALLNYYKTIYRVIGIVILAVGLCLMPFLDHLIEGDVPSDVSLYGAFGIYLCNTSLSYLLFAYRQSLLNVHLRNDLVNKAYIIAMSFQYVAQVAVLLAFPNFYLYAAMLPISTVVNNVAASRYAHKLFPQYDGKKIKGCYPDKATRADIKKKVSGLMVSKICQTTRTSVDSIIVSAFLGLTTVGMYTNYLLVVSAVSGILATITNSIGPSIGNSVATESREKNYGDLRLFTFIYAMVAIVCTACMLCLYQPFMGVWVGDGLMLPFSMVLLFAAYFYALTMGDIRTLYVSATGIWWELRWRSIVEAVSNIVLSLALVQVLGLPGVMLGTLISLFFINFAYGSHLIFRYYFGLDKAKAFYLDHMTYLCVAALVSGACFWISSLVSDGGVALLVLKGLVVAGASSLMVWLLFAKTKRMRSAFDLAKRVFASR